MALLNFVHTLRPTRRHPRPRPTGYRPRVECLEDRTVPSLFAPPILSPAGPNPGPLVVGDFNGDGRLDLAVANGDAASVLLGDGGGSFIPGPSFQASTEPIIGLAVGDFNGDGHLDLAVLSLAFVTNHDVSSLSVFLGDGHGGFTPAPGSPRTANVAWTALAVVDVNGDGHPDLLVTDATQDSVDVFLGDGKGGFGPPTSFPAGPNPNAGGPSLSALAVGDFNGDGHPDVAVIGETVSGMYPFLNFESTVSVLLGDGKGGFGAPTSFGVSGAPGQLALGDFNGDGHLDLATATTVTSYSGGGYPTGFTATQTGVISVFLGDGTGHFASAPTPTLSAGSYAAGLVAADFNGDGHLDLAATSDVGMVVYLGDGTGHFASAPGSPFPAGPNPLALAVGDFNNDGRPDLVTTNPQANAVSVLLNQPADPNEVYVAQLYQNLLGRPADPGGLAHWTGLLESGSLTRAGVARLIEASPEFQQDEIQGLYQHYLHRSADSAGLQAWAQAMRQGATVEQIAAALLGSPEYYQEHGGTPGGFATALYLDVLGRMPSASEAANVEQALAAGFSTSQVAAVLLSSTEYEQRVVEAYYQVFLHRPADPVGLTYSVYALRHGLRDEDVLAEILGSPEYFGDL